MKYMTSKTLFQVIDYNNTPYELLTSEIDANTLNEHTTLSKYYNHYMWLKYSIQDHVTSSANGWELQLLCYLLGLSRACPDWHVHFGGKSD